MDFWRTGGVLAAACLLGLALRAQDPAPAPVPVPDPAPNPPAEQPPADRPPADKPPGQDPVPPDPAGKEPAAKDPAEKDRVQQGTDPKGTEQKGTEPKDPAQVDPGAPPPEVQPVAPPAAVPARPEPPPAWAPRYSTLDEVAAWSSAWIATGSAEAVPLPPSREGRAVPALAFGADGPTPLAARPTVFLLGGLDGTSLTGCEAAMRATDELLRDRAALPATVAFVCVPWAAPDGLARALAGESCDGRDLTPVDDDGDLAFDEDPPDDLDGDGHALEMYVEDPKGTWARAEGSRRFVPAGPGDRVRYVRAREGKDDDGDGRYNEDVRGGVVLDLSYPVGWSGEPGGLGGTLPLDDELSRALADLTLARPPFAVLVLQASHGLVARPGGVAGLPWSDGSGSTADEVAVRLFAAATGRVQTDTVALRHARGGPRPGASIDWFHAVVGALAAEVSAWGPLVPVAANGRGTIEAAWPPRREGERGAPPTPAEIEAAWARWLDDVRGGIGFVDWHPVDLEGGRAALVGGWMPFARENAPVEALDDATRGMGAFVRALSSAAPRLELRVLEASRDGEVVTVRVRVENRGGLPTGLVGAQSAEARMELVLPSGARLLWGESDARLGALGPGETSREITAVALVPAGAALKLSARAPWAAPVEAEVKP